jgi:hypothetical protein
MELIVIVAAVLICTAAIVFVMVSVPTHPKSSLSTSKVIAPVKKTAQAAVAATSYVPCEKGFKPQKSGICATEQKAYSCNGSIVKSTDFSVCGRKISNPKSLPKKADIAKIVSEKKTLRIIGKAWESYTPCMKSPPAKAQLKKCGRKDTTQKHLQITGLSVALVKQKADEIYGPDPF